MGAERRTERTSLSVTSAFGYGAGGLSAGSLIAGYRTPAFGLSYGEVAGPSDSQLQIGGFARGIGLAVPLRNGDLNLLGRDDDPDRSHDLSRLRHPPQLERAGRRVFRRRVSGRRGAGRRPPDHRGLRLSPLRRKALDPDRGRPVVDARRRRRARRDAHSDRFPGRPSRKEHVHDAQRALRPRRLPDADRRDRPGALSRARACASTPTGSATWTSASATPTSGSTPTSSTTTARRCRAARAGRTPACSIWSGSRGTRFAGGDTLNRTAAVTLTQSLRNCRCSRRSSRRR